MLQNLLSRPTAVLLTTLAAILLGLLAATQLPVSLLPEVGIPRVSVQVSYPNAAARTVEEAVVSPLRNTLLQVNGLADIRSRARDESAVLFLDFPFGTDPDLAFIEVNEKIDRAMNGLPRGLERPRVLATDVSDVPIVQLSVTLADTAAGNGLLELSELARRVLRRRLEQQSGIAFADLSGQLEPRLAVRPDGPALRALGLDEDALASLLRGANVELGGLLLNDGHYQYAVRFSGNLRTAEDLRHLYFRVGNGRIVPLGDLATVTYEAIPPRGAYYYDGRPGVIFTIRKRSNARLFELREDLHILLTDLRTEYPRLRFDLANDQTAVLRASIDNLRGGLLYGAGFAVLVLFAFFREWRRPLLIALAVPVALLIAVLGFYAVGLSINVVSLAGLILGLGLMIDNSIIVLDNIDGYKKAHQGIPASAAEGAAAGAMSVEEAGKATTAAAVNEVIRPLLSSALTTLAVFLPLVLLSGIAGALFRDQAIAVALALTASLLVAYFLLPLLSQLLDRSNSLPPDERSEHSLLPRPPSPQERDLGRGHERSEPQPAGASPVRKPTRLQDHKTTLLLLPFLVLGYLLLTLLPVSGFPEISRTDYRVEVDWNEPLPLNVHRTRVRALTNDWRTTLSGHSAAFAGEDRFLLSTENRPLNASELQFYLPEPPVPGFADDWLARWQNEYPLATFRLTPVANLFDRIFLNDDPFAELRLRDATGGTLPEPAALQPLINELSRAGFPLLTPARDPTIALQIDYEQLRISQVSPDRLRARLLTLFNENEVTQLRANDRALPVLLASTDALTSELLLAATVTNRNGDEIPLRLLLQTNRSTEYRTLAADRGGEYLPLVFPGEPGPEAIERIRSIVANHPAFTARLTGRFLADQGRVRELGTVLLVSLLLLYLILAAQFEGLRLPFVVLLVVPVSLVGSLFALWISGGGLNLLSLIGMVVTGGIVVNDAIIKVDMIERGRAAGLDITAAIKEASRRRLRAIVMTSLTTILALAPVLFTSGLGAELQQPLAITVIGGLVVGTLGSLYVVPGLYRLLSPAIVQPTKK